MRRVLAVLLVILVCMAGIPVSAETVSARICGEYEYVPLSDTSACIRKYYGSASGVVIPDTLDGYTVTAIGDYAFYFCSTMRSVMIPETVTAIGEEAFSYCDLLRSVNIPDALTEIGVGAFSSCPQLDTFLIADRHPHYDLYKGILIDTVAQAVVCCPQGLRHTSIELPDGIRAIRDYAFGNCADLASVSLPESLETIGSCAFLCCGALREIDLPERLTSVGSEAFSFCGSLQSVSLPASLDDIGTGAFAYCSSLCEFRLSAENSRCTLIDGALVDTLSGTLLCCPAGLRRTEWTVPEGCSVGAYAFYGCRTLERVTVSAGTTSIGDCAFGYCDALCEVTLPEGLVSIGSAAFLGCRALKDLSVPASVTSIGRRAFADCPSSLTLTAPEGSAALLYAGQNGIRCKAAD